MNTQVLRIDEVKMIAGQRLECEFFQDISNSLMMEFMLYRHKDS
jgi:hypothetical protein